MREASPAFVAFACEQIASLGAAVEQRLERAGQAEERRMKTDRLFPVLTEATRLLDEVDPGQADDAAQRLLEIDRRWFRLGDAADRRRIGEEMIALLLRKATAVLQQKKLDERTYGRALPLLEEARNVADAIDSPRLSELRDRVRKTVHRQKAAEQIDRLKTVLERSPGAMIARKTLVRMLLVDMDAPAAAAKWVEPIGDATLTRRVTLAARPLEKLEPEEARDLGRWYRELAAEAEGPARLDMLYRARRCFEHAIAALEQSHPLRQILARDLGGVVELLQRYTPEQDG
jgi:hypothetical protein